MTSRNRPNVVLVAIAAALVFAAGVGSVARDRAGYPINPIDILSRDTTSEGRRELRALRKDPVLDFRAPGTDLRRSTDVAAGRDWKNAAQPTEIRRQFTLKSEPGVAVEAYRARAAASGWQVHDVRCSFEFGSTSVRLTRPVLGKTVTLNLYGYVERQTSYNRSRGLLVSIKGAAPSGPADGPEGAGLPRRDLHCLRGLDPDSPDLRPPALQPESASAICGLLTVAEARKILPAVTEAKPTINAGLGCRYAAGAGRGFTVTAADEPRAHYQDDQSPHDPGRREFVLLDHDTSGPPEGVWVDTRIGPVRVYGGTTPTGPGLDAGQLIALAQLLGRR